MQLLKWIILPLFLAAFLSRESHMCLSGAKTEVSGTAKIKDIPGSCSLDLYLSFLKTNAGDLAESGTHNNYDKKTFLRLLFHPGYDHRRLQPDSWHSLISGMFLFSGLQGVDYYIYTLQKIIV